MARLQSAAMAMACAITGIWSGVLAYAYWTDRLPVIAFQTLDVLKPLCWLAFLLLFTRLRPSLSLSLTAAGAVVLVIFEAGFGGEGPAGAAKTYALVSAISRISLGILALVAIENIYRNFDLDDRWKVKFFCVGLGGLFIYDFFFYANALVAGENSNALFLAKGVIYVMVFPLLLVATNRSKLWHGNLILSHQGAFYSTAVLGGGFYLLTMAAAAYYLREVGGTWGAALQLIFLFGALLLLAIVLVSGAVRARVKVFIATHFFETKYDYRTEWLRFMDTLSTSDDVAPLEQRVIRSIADIVESPGGALWRNDGRQLAIAATWNMAAPSLSEAEAKPLIEFLQRSNWVIAVDSTVEPSSQARPLALPAIIKDIPGAWIMVPLVHADRLHGVILLARPRAPRSLDWEDYELLRTVGRQAAIYLAENQGANQLAEARQFERFNRQAAFVIHDIKNLVSRLSLLGSNIEKHGDNAAFRKDLPTTVLAVSRQMRDIVARLRPDGGGTIAGARTVASQLLNNLPLLTQADNLRLSVDEASRCFELDGDEGRLSSILNHILENAADAAGAQGWVKLSFHTNAGKGVFEITDNGSGLDPAFVRDELFKPFRSTKRGGLGLGMFQCREYARELGGDLDVISSPGAGTTVRISLPGSFSAAMGKANKSI